METSVTGRVLLCYHCGNKTFMELVATHKHIDSENIEDRGHIIGSVDYVRTWFIYSCKVCGDITLLREKWFSEEVQFDGSPIVYTDIVYPQVTHNSSIPKDVSEAFEAAIKVRHIDGAICVLSLRRALEKMCKDKGATQRDLYSMLKHLADIKVLPPILDEMAYVLKQLGNAAAHADDMVFDENIVRSMIEFTTIILDYVYNIPARLKEVQGVLGEINTNPMK